MLRDRSGMALVLTLLAVSFLVAVTVQLGTSVNWQMQAAANQRNIVQLDAMLLSGLHIARAALLADQLENDFDSGLDLWGEFEADRLAAIFGNGRMEIKVTDLTGLLPVNALVFKGGASADNPTQTGGEEQEEPQQIQGKSQLPRAVTPQMYEKNQRDFWNRFLLSENFAVEDEEAVAEMLDSLSDWIDDDDDERDNGAELGYYSSLHPPYVTANRPLRFPEELLLVRGWNKKLLYGEKEHSGIIDYLTITGQDGKININTAPDQVLLALSSEMTEEAVVDLIEFRSNIENREQLARSGWYNGVIGGIAIGNGLLTTKSSYFKVTVTARIDALLRRGSGVVHRKDNNEQTLVYWKVE